MRRKILLSWSSGKDSAWCLHLLRQDPYAARFEVAGLLTTFNEAFDRVAMHSVRRGIVIAQAESVGLPLWHVPLPWPSTNAQYEGIMADVCRRSVAAGISAIAFGDLFLSDVREYRERQLAGTGLEPVFPLWNSNTRELAEKMIRNGLRARVSCIDPRYLGAEFAGNEFDNDLLRRMPAAVDPCGENGEFHTCVYCGPMFRRPLSIVNGETVARDGFVFADLLINESPEAR